MTERTAELDGESPEELERQARTRLAEADLSGAAGLLERAALSWQHVGNAERAGTGWLLAASTWRLAGSMEASAHAARCAEVLDLPDALRRGVDMELAEQALACGDAALAREQFSTWLLQHGQHIDDRLRAVVLQRRAAAALSAHDERGAAADFSSAAALMQSLGLAADVQAARLAAASCLSMVDAPAAEAIWRDVDQQPARDGSAAARQGLVGAQIALALGQPVLALERLARARQGALDARDATSYLAASVQAASLLEQQGQAQDAYARLASAWVTLGDLLGKEPAANLVRPALAGLRERLGEAVFQRVRQAHNAQRRRA
jgi:hypothetical protein